MTAIRADGLYKCYERRNWRGRVVESVEAVRGISFEVQPGEMAAFLGANGAGKSTTLRLLSGVLTPTRGEASICGHRSGTPEAAMRFGFVSGNRSLGVLSTILIGIVGALLGGIIANDVLDVGWFGQFLTAVIVAAVLVLVFAGRKSTAVEA